MKIAKLIFIILTLTLGLSGCAFNEGFPKEIDGRLKPINSERVKNSVG